MNSYNVKGRLVADPEFKVINGKELTKFTIAVPEVYNKEHTNFFDVVAWQKTAELIANHFSKGKEIGITGRLQQERWEKDGQKHSKIVIVCEAFDFIGKKEE